VFGPFGALLVAFSLQFGHWQVGPSFLRRRSLLGLTRMLSKIEDGVFMTGRYALNPRMIASLDSGMA